MGQTASQRPISGVSLCYDPWQLCRSGRGDLGGAGWQVRVHRVVCAVDCGWTVNPDTIKAQIAGGIVYGLTAALYGEITIKNGRVEAEQLQRLSGAAHERDAGDRGLYCARAPRTRAGLASWPPRRSPPPWSTRFLPRRASASAACLSARRSCGPPERRCAIWCFRNRLLLRRARKPRIFPRN